MQGLDQRFNDRAMRFMRAGFKAALKVMIQREGQAVVLPQFNGVYVTDCTRLVWGALG